MVFELGCSFADVSVKPCGLNIDGRGREMTILGRRPATMPNG